ncbi:MAG: ATP-binding cassette domain-containing protein [Blautia sp.]|nr:ATP-binding cassette domain-containing protein [Blautia sp.]
MAGAVLGEETSRKMDDERLVTKGEIDDILKYYHLKPVTVPEEIQGIEEQIEYCLRPYGMMKRNVTLPGGWYKDCAGPILAFWKDTGLPEALLPDPVHGYYYRKNGKRIRVNRKNEDLFERSACCFYAALPQRKIGITDLFSFLKKCVTLADILWLVFLTVLTTVAGMAVPRLNALLTGMVLDTRDQMFLAGTAVFMITIAVVSKCLGIVRSLMMNRLEVRTSLSIEAAVMMRIIGLPAGFFKQYNAGNLSSRIGAVNQLCSLLLGTVLSTGITSLSSLLYIAQIFRFSSAMVIPSLMVILAQVLMSVVSTIVQMRITKETLELSAKESGMNFALINGIQKVRLAGAEKRAFARWGNLYAQEARILYDPPLFIKINSALTALIPLLGNIVLYYTAVQSRMSVSDYVGFTGAYGAVMGAFTSLAGIALSIAHIKPILDMAEPILQAEPEYNEEKEIVTGLDGRIEINDLCFRYNDSMPYVINKLSLNIRAGEYIAFVGATGCGKSTLVRLLLGFETPDKGAIFYDGKDLSGLDLRSLRKRIGVVTQDGGLFQGDIFSNISISAPQMTMKEAWEAAEIAGIADDIREMPMGMFTMISEGQGGISGGQKQRLMIARAVAPKPKILILDEATSALDNRTQKQVADSLDRLNCTRIVVAHRLSTIRHCDRILVFGNGKIQEEGTYEELIARNGYFAELVERQRLDIHQ